ncbi:DUF2231 domain-containing protein [Plantactinospora sp. GCM10030261]|uniref:DUF2231 domain-containing protein n=1 Tax=Plantactinospora sp. GCM10030261 TaxID=3273420 RepID=UPI00361E3A96
MFREIQGLPAHALLVHAAVALVPMLILAAVAYALVPRFRSKVGWLAGLLSVAAVAAVYVAKESGEQLEAVLVAKNYPPEILGQVTEHAALADLLFWWTLGLAAATLLLLLITSGYRRVRALPTWLSWLLAAVVVVLAGVTGWYVYQTGDTGARAVWEGVL